MRSASGARPGLEDLVTMMSGAAGGVAGLYDELKLAWRTRLEELVGTLDLVPRTDLAALQASVAALTKRVAALEAAAGIAPKQGKAAATPQAKPKAKAKAKPQAKAKATAKAASTAGGGISARARALIAEGLDNKAVLDRLQAEFPGSKVNLRAISTYRGRAAQRTAGGQS